MQNTLLIKLVESQLNINNNPTEWSTLNSRDRGISCPSLSLYDITHKDVSDVSNHSFCMWNSDLECSTLLDINNNPPPPSRLPSQLTLNGLILTLNWTIPHLLMMIFLSEYLSSMAPNNGNNGRVRGRNSSQGFAKHGPALRVTIRYNKQGKLRTLSNTNN